jgi:hypothetical protein
VTFRFSQKDNIPDLYSMRTLFCYATGVRERTRAWTYVQNDGNEESKGTGIGK